ncbi:MULTISPECIES: hypothetical protein [Streptomyces]|uniref:Secreted protein n=1 Tax=Streptomyces sudanensis TaxID=436397 RepID=A0ABY4TAR1_9ACTN|nr:MULTISPECIES: hypothetical protein [Streptomyces]MCP9957605.1 hypothetical protein [Streptomyces sudanensis]MCQ0001852.1 hypothetical protein [Streptomyces sudanensis]URN15298.1 hypothetical protein MW084_04320 [Streptomyces sudanensis]
MKKTFIAACGIALTAMSTFAVPSASAAQADVSCDTWQSSKAPYRGYAKCSGMLPWPLEGAKVKLTCIDPRGKQWNVHGKIVGNGETSSAKCSDSPNVGIYKVGVIRNRL